jgi:hypothetical protein
MRSAANGAPVHVNAPVLLKTSCILKVAEKYRILNSRMK